MTTHQKTTRGIRVSGFATALLTVTALAIATPARAQVLCGDVIVGVATMTSNITGCAVNPTVSVDGGTLDMDGYSIIGSLGDGIRVIGNGGRVENGRVQGSTGDGIVLGGNGGHRVENVVSSDNAGAGYHLLSDNNRLEYTSSTNNNVGWLMEPGSDNNTVRYSAAHDNPTASTIGGNRSDIRDSVISNSPNGFLIAGDRNQFRDVALSRTSVFVNGNRNKFKYVHTMGGGASGDIGFDLSGDRNRVENTRLTRHGVALKLVGDLGRFRKLTITDSRDVGILITGSDNRVDRNLVTATGINGVGQIGIGVQAGTAVNNQIERNTAVGHLLNDLADVDPVCANNIWMNNIEKLKNPACIN